jgi:hypothetical protein
LEFSPAELSDPFSDWRDHLLRDEFFKHALFICNGYSHCRERKDDFFSNVPPPIQLVRIGCSNAKNRTQKKERLEEIDR